MGYTEQDIAHTNEQYRRYAMSRNAVSGPQTYYLAIKREGEWEQSLQNTDADYLKDRGETWTRMNLCEDWQVNAYPVGKRNY